MTIVERLQPFTIKMEDASLVLPMQHGRGLAAAPHKPHKPHGVLVPRGNDCLWWCFYIIMNGLEAYQALNVSDMLEKRLKIEHITDMKKAGKCTDKMEASTVHNKRLDLPTFLSLCEASNKGIFYVDEPHKTYSLHSVGDDGVCAAIIVSIKNGLFGIDIEGSEIQYRNTHLLVNRLKPLKSCGAYKAAELTEMVAKLAPNEAGKKRTKAENYELIRQIMGI